MNRQELETVAKAELAEHERLLRQAGVDLPVTRGVLDLDMGQLQALAATWGVVSGWDLNRFQMDRPLSTALKVIPPADAEAVTQWLRHVGLLPPEEAVTS